MARTGASTGATFLAAPVFAVTGSPRAGGCFAAVLAPCEGAAFLAAGIAFTGAFLTGAVRAGDLAATLAGAFFAGTLAACFTAAFLAGAFAAGLAAAFLTGATDFVL